MTYDPHTDRYVDEMDVARDARQRAEDCGEPWPPCIGDPLPPRKEQPHEGENHHAKGP